MGFLDFLKGKGNSVPQVPTVFPTIEASIEAPQEGIQSGTISGEDALVARGLISKLEKGSSQISGEEEALMGKYF